MQIIVTDGGAGRTRVLNIALWQLSGAALAAGALVVALSGAVYHFVFLKAAREGWPIVSQVVKPMMRDDVAQRDRYMRENLDAMASKVGELQAKLMKLGAVGERVSSLAGLRPEDLTALDRSAAAPAAASTVGPVLAPAHRAAPSAASIQDPDRAEGGKGGPYLPMATPSLAQLNAALHALDQNADQHGDVFTLAESRLLESRLRSLMVPSSAPVSGPVGSGFGFRLDPFTGRGALHSGLDFPAEAGTPIEAAAGGVVVSAESHPAYGLKVEIDHGNSLVTRYAHASKLMVKAGDIVKRGQRIAAVGSTGRSTGPHLHFEVLVEGVPQNPSRFLAQGGAAARAVLARAPTAAEGR